MRRRNRTFSGTTNPAVTERELRGRAVARKAAAEGMVLLKNEGQLLPLEKGRRLALYGSGASRTVKGGTGSGDVNERSRVSILEGLENAGFQITTKAWLADYEAAYKQAREDWKSFLFGQYSKSSDLMGFFGVYSAHPFQTPSGRPVSGQDVRDSDTDTAVYVVSRTAGEGADRTAAKGDYYLTDAERADLDFICESYPYVVLVVNAGAQIDLSYVEELSAIKSVLFMAQAGMEGGNALTDILSGAVTPSGKLTDTWARAYEDYPASATFSHNNGNVQQEYYRESIYVGYRYFDSFGIEPQYPFGFGLSYTEFALTGGAVTVDDGEQTVSVSATVKNVGEVYAGREVVQLYAACPQAGLAKERRRLCGFAKTKLLSPGEAETVTITVPVKALASYEERRHAWVTGQGVYGLFVGNSSRNLTLCAGLEVEADAVVEQAVPICPLQEPLDELVRPDDSAAAFETAWREELAARKLPVLPLKAAAERQAAYEPSEALRKARSLAERLTEEELIHMVVGEVSKGQGSESALGAASISIPGAAGETSAILEERYGVPGLPMADGPAGLRLSRTYEVDRKSGCILPGNPFAAFEGGFFVDAVQHENADTYYQYCTAIPVGVLLAQSWDTELLREVGRTIGEEMLAFGVTWWLAPGMNIHRDPLCGRNFEYYSEDPVVSGLIAAAMTDGVQSLPGIGTTVKHFACNNQEDNRMGSNSIVSERALREIYLRGFEIAVKRAQPMAIMTSYNLVNGVHSANNYDLCTQAARKEWGFAGIIMTDWTTTFHAGGSTAWKCAAAGNDLIMPGGESDFENIRQALAGGELKREELEACAARLISIAYQSNYYEGAVSYSEQFHSAR